MSYLTHFRATPDSVARMRRDVLFEHDDKAKRYSKFWVLMILSSALAAAGILTESIPALIGAMIVSPFITPMTGVMLAAALSQRVNVLRSVGQVLTGAAAAVAVGYLLGLLVDAPVTSEMNSLVAGRVVPIAFDIMVGLLTGVVAAVALVREDISNSVPGVAVAVTLISALAVAGLLLESGQYTQAWDSLVLFAANASATLAAGTLTMVLCGVRAPAGLADLDAEDAERTDDPRRGDQRRWGAVVALAAVALVMAAPLAATGVHLQSEQSRQDAVRQAALDWAEAHDVDFRGLDASGELLTVSFEGATPLPEPDALEAALQQAGVDTGSIEVRLMPVITHRLGDDGAVPEP